MSALANLLVVLVLLLLSILSFGVHVHSRHEKRALSASERPDGMIQYYCTLEWHWTLSSTISLETIYEYCKVQRSNRIIHAAERALAVVALEKLRVSKRSFLRCVMHIVNGTHRYMCSVIKRSDSRVPNGHWKPSSEQYSTTQWQIRILNCQQRESCIQSIIIRSSLVALTIPLVLLTNPFRGPKNTHLKFVLCIHYSSNAKIIYCRVLILYDSESRSHAINIHKTVPIFYYIERKIRPQEIGAGRETCNVYLFRVSPKKKYLINSSSCVLSKKTYALKRGKAFHMWPNCVHLIACDQISSNILMRLIVVDPFTDLLQLGKGKVYSCPVSELRTALSIKSCIYCIHLVIIY